MEDDLSFLRNPGAGAAGAPGGDPSDAALSALFTGPTMPIQHSPPATTAPPVTLPIGTLAGAAGLPPGPPVPTSAAAGVRSPQRPPQQRPPGWISTPRTPLIPTCTGAVPKVTTVALPITMPTSAVITTTAGLGGLATTAPSMALGAATVTAPYTGISGAAATVQAPSTGMGTLGALGYPAPHAGPPSTIPIGFGPTFNPSAMAGASSYVPSAAPPMGMQSYGLTGFGLGGAAGAAGPSPYGSVHAPPPPAPGAVPIPMGATFDPFGANFGPLHPTLNSQAIIAGGGPLIDWKGLQPATNFELLLMKQQLLHGGLAYPHAAPEVKEAIGRELTRMTANQWPQAVREFAEQIHDKSTIASRAQSSILANNMHLLITPPTLGNNAFSGSAIKSVQTGLQRRKLSGQASDPLDYSGIMGVLKNAIEQFGLNSQAAYLLAKEAFAGSLNNFLDSCASTGLPFTSFWIGIQGLLASTRSPAALLSMIGRIKSTKPSNIMEALNSLFQLHKLHANITHASVEDAFRATRSSYFEILRGHYPEYYTAVKQEDSLQMDLLRKKAEVIRRAGGSPMDAVSLYHPVLGIQQVVLYVLGNEVSRQAMAQPRFGAGGRGNFHGADNRFRRPDPRNAHIDELDMLSTRANSPTEVEQPDAAELTPVDEDEEKALADYEYHKAMVEQFEAMALDKKFKSFPKKTPPVRDGSSQGNDECYNCHRQGHWAKDCPEPPRRRPGFGGRRGPGNPLQANPTEFESLPTELTLQDLNDHMWETSQRH